MIRDCQFKEARPCQWPEQEHKYGGNVHLLYDPTALRRLAILGNRDTIQPRINDLVSVLYHDLLGRVMGAEFPLTQVSAATRMMGNTDTFLQATWDGWVTDQNTRVVVAMLPRAGILPAQLVYDILVRELDPRGVRQDHIPSQRTTDAAHKVTGAEISGAKIGGSVEGAILLIPDCMGATGSSVCTAIKLYKEKKGVGTPKRIILMHLAVTPEYTRRVTTENPEALIYAWRLDRGMSDPSVLNTIPGTRWDDERGLTATHYISPGLGGMGEVITNSDV